MKISIITITLNSEETIIKNLESVIAQSYKDVEHIIVDGGSNDKTMQIIKEKNFNKIVISKSKIIGIYESFNEALKLVNGDYFCFLNSDDYFDNENVLKNIIENIKKEKNPIYYGNINYVNKSNKIIRKWNSGYYNKRKLKLGWMPPHTGTLFSSKLLKNGLSFNQKYKISSDYDFMLRSIILSNHKLNYLNLTVTNMRLGGESNKNIQNLIKVFIEDYKIASLYFRYPIITVLMKKLRKINQYFF